MDVAALVVSIVALALSGASVAWNIYSWHNSGAQLEVKISDSFTKKPYGSAEILCLIINIDNAGRLETTISAIGFSLADKRTLELPLKYFLGNAPPKTLAPGASEEFSIPHSYLSSWLVKENAKFRSLKVRVRTGHKVFAVKVPHTVTTHLKTKSINTGKPGLR